MTNFVRDNTALPGPKTDWDSDPAKTVITNPEMYVAAADYNPTRQAAYDLRAWIQTGLTVGSYTNATLTVDADGRITGVAAGSSGVPTSRLISAGTGLSGGGSLAADRTLSLANTAVTPGAYTYGGFTVDAQGRLTAAASGAAPAPATRTLTAGTGLSGGGDLSADRSFALANTAVTPSSYTNTSLTVDAQGRITAASSGTAGVPTSRTLTTTSPLTIGGGASADLSADRTLAIATNGIGYTLEAQAPANTLTGNNTGGTANKTNLTVAQVISMLGLTFGSYGNGSDGAAVMDGSTAVTGCSLASGVYKALRSLQFTSIVMSGGATFQPDGYEHFCTGAVTGTGTIDSSGGDAVTTTAGAQTWTTPRQLPAGLAGVANGGTVGGASGSAPQDFTAGSAAGGTSSAGVSHAGTNGGTGGGGGGGGSGGLSGGAGNAGGAGGALTLNAHSSGDANCKPYAFSSRDHANVAFTIATAGGGGGNAGSGGGAGGASGAGGSWMSLHFFSIASTITIKSKGGNGGAGTAAGAGSGAGGGAGGGGGGGGLIAIETSTAAGSLTTNVTGGTAGAGAAGDGTSYAGAAGGTGGAGKVYVWN